MCFLVFFLLIISCLTSVYAEDGGGKNVQKGLKFAGVPNISYNSDEGFGYGARLSCFHHAEGGYNPYHSVLDTNIFLTTGGRKEFFIFFDSPYMLKSNYRITCELKYQKYNFSPYYGIGNDTEYHEKLTEMGNRDFIHEQYYRYERIRSTFWINFQYLFGTFQFLGGVGLANTDITMYDGKTVLGDDEVLGKNGGITNYVKFGVIHDTRDFEPAPGKGDWTDIIIEYSNRILGSDYDYTRITLTNRYYLTVYRNVVFAERIVLEKIWGGVPFYEMAFFESSYRIQEGLGGAKSVRGLLLNRFVGPAKLFGNLELRWRLFDFSLMKQNMYFAWSGFYDFGRVWKENQTLTPENIHYGYGSGLHIGWNENFIISLDFARSMEVDSALYIGIGYLY